MTTILSIAQAEFHHDFMVPDLPNRTDSELRSLAKELFTRFVGPLVPSIESFWVDRFTSETGERHVVLQSTLPSSELRSA